MLFRSETQERLSQGERVVEILKQGQHVPMAVEKQIIIIFAVINKYLADVDIELIADFETEFLKFMDMEYPEIVESIASTGDIGKEIEPKLREAIERFKKEFKEDRG